MIYTDRYLSKFWLVVINEIIQNIEKKYLKINSLNNKILSLNKSELYKYKKYNIFNLNLDISIKIKTLLENIEKNINKNINLPKLLIYKYYYINNNFIYIPIIKNTYYDTLKFYQKDLNNNISQSYLIINYKYINNKNIFLSLNIDNMPKILNYNEIIQYKYNGLFNEELNNEELNNEELNNDELNNYPSLHDKIIFGNEQEELKKKKMKDFNELVKHCVFPYKLEYLKNSLNNYKTQTDCINIGGKWDKSI